MEEEIRTGKGKVLYITTEEQAEVKREEDDDAMNPIGVFAKRGKDDFLFFPSLRNPLVQKDVEILADLYDSIQKGLQVSSPQGYLVEWVRKVTVSDESREGIGLFISKDGGDWQYESLFRRTDEDEVKAILNILDRLKREGGWYAE